MWSVRPSSCGELYGMTGDINYLGNPLKVSLDSIGSYFV